jgi:hypothetical protein
MRPFIMKFIAKSATALLGLSGAGYAQALTIPGADGSDGALTVDCYGTRTIDLSQAATGAWNSPGAGNGVYDPNRWAVVFKYSSVSLPANCNAAINFTNHPTRAPVVWLVSGNVIINTGSSISVSGGAQSQTAHGEPGPGGFRGGVGYQSASLPASGGFGPGGGEPGTTGQGGNYSTRGGLNTGPTYGNARILPLIGGSGGGGQSNRDLGSGGAGGALLIAATGAITLNGVIFANGTCDGNWPAGCSSGGAVRLVAETITGNGRIEANGGSSYQSAGGGAGRIRLETNSYTGSIVTSPVVNAVQPDNPVLIWPPATAPTVRVVSIGGVNAPADPRALLTGSDLTLNNVATGNIVLETQNVEADASVMVRVVPKYGDPFSVNATLTSGTPPGTATWTAANVNLPADYFVVQARAENPAP